MNITELHEGAEPKLPGAPRGIKIMTPQQFVAKAGEAPEAEQDVTEMDNRSPSGDRREQRANSPEAMAQRKKEQQSDLKKVSPEMRKKLRLPEPKEGVAEGMNDWALKDKHTPRSIPRTSEKNNWSKKDIHNRAYDFPPTNYDKDGKDMYGQKKPELKSQAEGVAESDNTKPKLGTVKANLMHTQEPTVQVQVFKHNTLRGDSYWVTKEVRKFKTMDQAQAYVDRVNKQGVAEDDAGDVEQRMLAKIEKEKQRLAKLKQTDPEAYKREIAKRKTSSRIPPVSTFENQGVAEEVESTVAENYEAFKKGIASSRAEHIKLYHELVALRAKKDAAKKVEPKKQGVAEDLKMLPRQGNETNAERQKRLSDQLEHEYKTRTGQFADYNDNRYPSLNDYNTHGDDEYQAKKLKKQQGVTEGNDPTSDSAQDARGSHRGEVKKNKDGSYVATNMSGSRGIFKSEKEANAHANSGKQGVAEGQEHLDRIRSLSGLAEATTLPAQSREFGGDEFQDYMKRIQGTPDVDKQGNVKVDKKGIEKYTSGKTKSDRYKMPYIHRSSVVTYLSPDGKTYDEEAVKKTLAIRPKALLKQNEKMKHSNGDFEQFFNVGFAALTGLALDEQTNKLIIVNTCPGAGSCKVDCFAMKGGKIQFQGPWQSDGRILTYLLNDPTGFFNQLSNEITKEEKLGQKGSKGFEGGWRVTVRWHDAGDFFSPEYLDLALKMAAKHPNVRFYAYTKMAAAALAKKPDNFIINWSEGANTTQEKQVKAQDPELERTKNSRIVPEKLFYDLLAKDEKGNLKKTAAGAWQPAGPEELRTMKERIAKEYGISPSSILSYDEYMSKGKNTGLKYNVIVAPGEGDVSANDPGVLSTLLLRH